MKKLISIVLVCIMIMSMTACASTRRFESESAMMEHLNGMWVMDDTYEDKTYYVFLDGEVYNFNDVQFCGSIEGLFSSFVADEKIAELSKLDYKSAMDILGANEFLGNPEGIVAKPKKGMIIVDEGKTYEKQIIITEDGVFVKAIGEDEGIALTKLSNTADFTGEHFEKLFTQTKENYTIPTSKFWMDAKEYGAIVKANNPEVDGWDLITQNETNTIYESSNWVPNISGTLLISDTSVTFSRKVSLLNTWTSNIDWNPTFTIHYTPNEGKILIIDQDNLSLDLPALLQYAAIAVQNFPGAYDDYMDLYKDLSSEKGTTSNGAFTVEKTINGLTYKIQLGTNGYWAMVTITANDTISLSTVMNSTQIAPEETQPDQTESTQPVATEPVVTAPMSEVPYTTSISGATPIYSRPDSSSSFVQNVGLDGIYTIVEEAYDGAGNLWGRLKSGLGWVMLKGSSTSSVRTCPQCGQSEPDAIFTEDWKPGDICFGCSYDNFHGGEEGKLYCSQCGADCTYRGLEEDGRCEDCYFGN